MEGKQALQTEVLNGNSASTVSIVRLRWSEGVFDGGLSLTKRLAKATSDRIEPQIFLCGASLGLG